MSDDNQGTDQRFEIIEALLREQLTQGQSPTLEAWMSRVRTTLGPLTEGGSPRDRRTAGKIAAAYESAAELIATLAAENNDQGGA